MLLHLSVSHSVHRGAFILACTGQTPPLGRHPPFPGKHPLPRADTPLSGQTPHPQVDPTPQQTATAADDTHPTGMHSCF